MLSIVPFPHLRTYYTASVSTLTTLQLVLCFDLCIFIFPTLSCYIPRLLYDDHFSAIHFLDGHPSAFPIFVFKKCVNLMLQRRMINQMNSPHEAMTRSNIACHEANQNHTDAQAPPSSQFGGFRSNGQSSSSYATAPEGGSPTDDDDDDDMMPPSPTTSSKAAQRRTEASAQISFGSAGRKRLSDSSGDSTSLKILRTTKGKQPQMQYSTYSRPLGNQSNILFKKPSIDALRSFQSASTKTSFTTSMNTSFTESTPMSSQQFTSQPFTANTSFTSNSDDKDDEDAFPAQLTHTSSITTGSGLDEDSTKVSYQLERESLEQISRERLLSSGNVALDYFQSSGNETRTSPETFGSIDEDALLETSFRVEASIDTSSSVTSPQGPFLRSQNVRQGVTSVSNAQPSPRDSPLFLHHSTRKILSSPSDTS
jgi:hypothetical protein